MHGLRNIIDLNKAAERLAKRRDSQQEKQDVQEEDCPVIAQLAFTVGAPGGSSAGHLFQLEDGRWAYIRIPLEDKKQPPCLQVIPDWDARQWVEHFDFQQELIDAWFGYEGR